jgi:hypothetical protein
MKKILLTLGFTAIGISSMPAHAQSFIFHLDGEVGNRQAYFSQLGTTNRTPPSIEFQPIEIKELKVAIIFESPEQPELAELLLQFECVAKLNWMTNKAVKGPASTDPVRVRVGPGSSILRRADLKTEDIPAGEWETRSDLPMLTAHKLACNDLEIEKAIRSVSDTASNVDKAALRPKMAEFGIINGYALTDLSIWTEYLDFTWNTIWKGAKRPDPSGKWSRQSTPEEIAEAQRKMAEAKQQLADLSDKTKRAYEPKTKEMQGKFAFDAAAAKLRGGRKMRDYESKMLSVWQAKTEDDIIARMGRPHFTDNGKLHFLSYGQEFDNQVGVASSSGETWVEGLYTYCDVRFVTMADSEGTYRVADIVLSIDSSNIMQTNFQTACGDLQQTPD